MASSRKGNRRKDPSWYDKSVAALSTDQEEVMEIPTEKVGLVIGTRGWRLQEIRDQTGIQITIKAGNQAHLTGTARQLQEAKKIIEEVVNPVCILEVVINRLRLSLLLWEESSFSPTLTPRLFSASKL